MSGKPGDKDFEDYDPTRLYSADSNMSLPGSVYASVNDATKNTDALTGMIIGIASLIFSVLGATGIVGLIFSIRGLRFRNPQGQPTRQGFAIAGIITSSLGILVGIYGIYSVVQILQHGLL